MADLRKFLHGLKPIMAMLLLQLISVGQNLLFKLAIVDGMHVQILVAYRSIFATGILAPIAFFVERKRRPKLTWKVALEAFFGGLFGGPLSQNFALACLSLTSVTFTMAITNLIPAVTVIAVTILGLEKLDIQTLAGKAKLIGTALGIGGAMVLTFYKGAEINIWSSKIDLTRGFGSETSKSTPHVGNYILGSLLGLGSCVAYALWLITQTKMGQIYPCPLSMSALMCITGMVQSVVYALCMDRKWEDWKLAWNIRLWTVVYAGTVSMAVSYWLVAWAIKVRGPIFVSVFTPLSLVWAAIMASLLLNEKLYVGTMIGAALIVLGLYAGLWGKHKEMKKMNSFSSESELVEVASTSIVCYSPATTGRPVNRNDVELPR